MVKINLLYYKNILDLVFVDFFKDHNRYFTKIDDKYVMSEDFNYSRLKKILKKYIVEKLTHMIPDFDITNPQFYFIIGSCLPKDNVLLNYKDDSYFPEKITKLMTGEFPIKYYLREKDIVVNMVRFNEILIELFDEFFKSRTAVRKSLGSKSNGLFFIKHKRLDCYSMYKIIKHTYGKTTCVNVYKEQLADMPIHIVAVNDMICKYINNKKELLKSSEFENMKREVKKYVDSCMSSCYG